MTGGFDLDPVGLAFLDEAPLRIEVAASTSLAREQVWAFFVDAPGWSSWFPGVEESGYGEQAGPPGVGTLRTATVNGMGFEETMLAWDEPSRWIYRIDRSTQALARAQVEATLFEPAAGGGTRVVWILACDPLPPMAAAAEALPGVLAGILEEAMHNVERLAAIGMRPDVAGRGA